MENVESKVPQELREFAYGESVPTAEPFHTQIDSNILETIAFYSIRSKKNPGKDPPYPELKKYIMILSHLHRSANLSRAQAVQSYFKVKNEVIEMDRSRYAGDEIVEQLLDAIEYNVYMIVFGDAERGKRQGFLARMVGSIREFNPGTKEANRPWWRRF